jgi:periplasmic divalent cation tolerance protein
MPKIFTITTTFDSRETCKDFSNQIINQKLAACCQIVPIDSIYFWKGKIANEPEFQLVCKTIQKDEIVNFIKSKHPYDLPEIVIQEVETTDEYFDFVKLNCK